MGLTFDTHAHDRTQGAPITRRQLIGCLASLGAAALASGCKLRMSEHEDDPLAVVPEEFDVMGKSISGDTAGAQQKQEEGKGRQESGATAAEAQGQGVNGGEY